MAHNLENYGLDFLSENEEAYMGLMGYIAREGKCITGYYGAPYIFKSTGYVEFWLHTKRTADQQCSITGANVHGGGHCVWNVVHSGIDITPQDASELERIIMVNQEDGKSGLLPIDVITADVLPSFLKGDKFKMQVVAQPLSICYYPDEEAYAQAQPEGKDGEKWLVANGSLIPASFLCNHAPERHEKGKDYESDSYVLFTATVKALYHGTFEVGDKEENRFIRCFADTIFGELEFDHTFEQVPEEYQDNIKIGAVISGVCILSGDVAIYEYENGAIKDFDHDLRLLRYTFVKGETERLRSVLSEAAAYESEASETAVTGPDRIIERLNFVHENAEAEHYAHLATITESDDAQHPAGTRCIVLASGDEKNYESIAFISVNESGMIEKITVTTNRAYRFRIDSPEITIPPAQDDE